MFSTTLLVISLLFRDQTAFGLEVALRPENGACDGAGPVTVEPGSVIHSPNYPSDYDPNSYCEWLAVTSPEEGPVEVAFYDFHVDDYVNCTDNVTIFDGESDKFPLLDELCGSDLPLPVVASGNEMLIRFESDANEVYRGFQAVISAHSDGLEACDENATTTWVYNYELFSTPYFPDNYPDNANCAWRVHSDNGFAGITFLHFDVELDDPTCAYDSVLVYDGHDDTFALLATLCGDTVPSSITGTSADLYVVFISDHSVNLMGFQAIALDEPVDACGNTTGPKPVTDGDIATSPNYPEEYPNNADCHWKARVDSGKAVMTFLDFAIQESVQCSSDGLAVYDGPDENAPLIGTYCGFLRPDPIVGNGTELYFHFYSDEDAVSREGFELIITQLDGGTMSED